MTSLIPPPTVDRKRKLVIDGRHPFVLLYIICTLTISMSRGCRCGLGGKLDRSGSRETARTPDAENPFETVLQSPFYGRRQIHHTSGTPTATSSTVDVEENDRNTRLDAIKADILDKLGIASETELRSIDANMANFSEANNVSDEERSRVLNLYRQSVEQFKGRSHRIYNPETGRQSRAKQFFSFKAKLYDDDASRRIRTSLSKRYVYVRFSLNDIPARTETETASAVVSTEFSVTSATLKLRRRDTDWRPQSRTRRITSSSRSSSSSISLSNSTAQVRVNVYRVLPDFVGRKRPRLNRKRKVRRRLLDSRLISVSTLPPLSSGKAGNVRHRHKRPRAAVWNEFDIASAVRDWIVDPSSNLGLLVAVETEPEPLSVSESVGLPSSDRSPASRLTTPVSIPAVRIVDLFNFATFPANSSSSSVANSPRRASSNSTRTAAVPSESSDSVPTLTVIGRQRKVRTANGDNTAASSSSARRRKRSASMSSSDDDASDCRRDGVDGTARCCRRPLWVSFREIGWDRWILAPHGYRAYYCDGACPLRHRVAHHHAGIQAIVNGVRPDAAPAPCCTATRMSPLPIAHLNAEGRPVVSVFDNMIVDECMCT